MVSLKGVMEVLYYQTEKMLLKFGEITKSVNNKENLVNKKVRRYHVFVLVHVK